MRYKNLAALILCVAGANLGGAAAAQQAGLQGFSDSLGYEPSPAYPHGRAHPDAPEELEQFAFFIGEFDCIDRQRNNDGDWREFPAIWNASYFLGGFGIQDKYYAQGFQTSNVRMFFPNEGVWKVSYFSAPTYASGEWVGKKQGDDIVLDRTFDRADGTSSVSRLTFYDISDEGFEWKGESIRGDADPVATWTSSCKRRGD